MYSGEMTEIAGIAGWREQDRSAGIKEGLCLGLVVASAVLQTLMERAARGEGDVAEFRAY